MNLEQLTSILNKQRGERDDGLVKEGVDEDDIEDNKTIFYNIIQDFKNKKVNKKNSRKKLIILMKDLFVTEDDDDDAIF